MTTITKSSAYSGAGSASADHQQRPITLYVTAAIPVLALGDVVQLAPIPKGAKVTRLAVTLTDLDSGTPALKLDFGLKSVSNTFIAASTAGQAAGTTSATDAQLIAAVAAGAGDDVRLTCNTAPATGVAGTASAIIEYIIP